MKFLSAALLAIGAAALSLKEADGQGPPAKGGDGSGGDGSGGDRSGGDGESELPFPAPDCPEKPKDAHHMSPEDVFKAIDTNDSGFVDKQEGFNALYCAVEWDEIDRETAEFVYDWMFSHADINEDGSPEELDFEEAMIAVDSLMLMEINMKREAEGKRPFPANPPSECPDIEDMDEDEMTLESGFDLVDQDKSGKVDAKEGF
jgi:acyl carrier protein